MNRIDTVPLGATQPFVLKQHVSTHQKTYPFWTGGLSSVIAASITHPLDYVKTYVSHSIIAPLHGAKQGFIDCMR